MAYGIAQWQCPPQYATVTDTVPISYMLSLLHSPGDAWKSTKSPGKENQSPGFSVKPKPIFFLCYFPNLAWPNWVLFPADSSMFFWVNRKCLTPVNSGSDWPFSVTSSGLQSR